MVVSSKWAVAVGKLAVAVGKPVVVRGEVRARALEGARRCVAHWANEGDAELLKEAVARYHRVRLGTASQVDIEGALDWLG